MRPIAQFQSWPGFCVTQGEQFTASALRTAVNALWRYTGALHKGAVVSMAGWRGLKVAALLLVVSGCASLAYTNLNDIFGPQQPPPQRTVMAESAGARLYSEQVQPLLADRCVVCHGCYDAPCQLKLTSGGGIERGLTKAKVYDGERLLASTPTRLHIDAQTAEEWRKLGFAPVLNERNQNEQVNLQASVLMRALEHKKAQPLPAGDILPDSFDFALDRNQQCPSIEEYDSFAEKYPLWGMPYGLPGLTEAELAPIERWVRMGSPLPPTPALSDKEAKFVSEWEQFFNQDSFKGQLVSRYLYEHLFLNHLYFDEISLPNNERPRFFNLVRSSTPPGTAIDLIPSRRPYDSPGVERVYYRLQPEPELLVAKNHNPYALNGARMARWQSLFLTPEYPVDYLPGYEVKVATNPFKAFEQLPINARHRFLLDNAESTIMGFIKGPVCRGQMAVNVIQDHFWVFFVSPDLELGTDGNVLQLALAEDLGLPAEASSNALPLSNWIKYSRQQSRYLSAKVRVMNELIFKDQPIDLSLVWDGDGYNNNAALTIFRHFDNATVVKGLVGDTPKTAWIIDYPLFERIHYLLVSGFDVFGNLGHQLVTRLYMDFLRMEGEFNFLALLPTAERLRLRDYWYRGASDDVQDYLYGSHTQLHREPAIKYQTNEPQQELYQLLTAHLQPLLEDTYTINSTNLPAAAVPELLAINKLEGLAVSLLPEVTLVALMDKGQLVGVSTLLRTSAHTNISSLFDERANRRPHEDSLSVVAGIVGDYPNAFWQVELSELNGLAAQIGAMANEKDYQALLKRVGVRRSDPRFWPLSDAIARWNSQNNPITAGILDYNRLENR